MEPVGRLFRRAVERETVTVELVRRIVAYLRRAQDDHELRFGADERSSRQDEV